MSVKMGLVRFPLSLDLSEAVVGFQGYPAPRKQAFAIFRVLVFNS